MVWALYPESNQRTLEEMDLLFAAKTPWVWDAERNFKRLKAEHPEITHAAHQGAAVHDLEGGQFREGERDGSRSSDVKDEGKQLE